MPDLRDFFVAYFDEVQSALSSGLASALANYATSYANAANALLILTGMLPLPESIDLLGLCNLP